MNDVVNTGFGLLTGFAYLHIGIAGIVGCFLSGIVSAVVWWGRKQFLKGLAGAIIVLLVPLLMIGAMPGFEMLAVPIGLIAAALVTAFHYMRWKSEDDTKADAFVAVIAGFSLVAIALAFILGSLSKTGG